MPPSIRRRRRAVRTDLADPGGLARSPRRDDLASALLDRVSPWFRRAAPGFQEQRRRTQRDGKPSPKVRARLLVVSLPRHAQAKCPRGVRESCWWSVCRAMRRQSVPAASARAAGGQFVAPGAGKVSPRRPRELLVVSLPRSRRQQWPKRWCTHLKLRGTSRHRWRCRVSVSVTATVTVSVPVPSNTLTRPFHSP
jgi:hypothetical protein